LYGQSQTNLKSREVKRFVRSMIHKDELFKIFIRWTQRSFMALKSSRRRTHSLRSRVTVQHAWTIWSRYSDMRKASWRIYCARVWPSNILNKLTRSMVAPFPQVCLHIQVGLRMGPLESNSAHLDFHAVLYLENEFYSSQRFGVPAARMDGFVHVVRERGLAGSLAETRESNPIDTICCWKELHPLSSKGSLKECWQRRGNSPDTCKSVILTNT